MSTAEFVRWVGISHLLQPPLTAFLASQRGLGLRRNLVPDSPLGAEVLHNMAVASVALPTALGLLVAHHASEALLPGAARNIATLVAGFWCWRLYRQIRALRPVWPATPARVQHLNGVLITIFVVQGPVLGCVLWLYR